MTTTDKLAERLRAACQKLRTTAMPLADLIPLAQQAADEIDRLQHNVQTYKNALWRASGDDEECVDSYVASEGGLK